MTNGVDDRHVTCIQELEADKVSIMKLQRTVISRGEVLAQETDRYRQKPA